MESVRNGISEKMNDFMIIKRLSRLVEVISENKTLSVGCLLGVLALALIVIASISSYRKRRIERDEMEKDEMERDEMEKDEIERKEKIDNLEKQIKEDITEIELKLKEVSVMENILEKIAKIALIPIGVYQRNTAEDNNVKSIMDKYNGDIQGRNDENQDIEELEDEARALDRYNASMKNKINILESRIKEVLGMSNKFLNRDIFDLEKMENTMKQPIKENGLKNEFNELIKRIKSRTKEEEAMLIANRWMEEGKLGKRK